MTQEEKAKRYDEALEKGREVYNRGYYVSGDLEYIFPEFKESEDEKVRKALVELVKCNERSGYTLLNNVSTSSMLDWLEKQGEQKPADNFKQKFKVGDWVVNTVGDTNQVVKVLYDGYTLDDNTFISNSWATEHYRLWTIQDAKDGDILFAKGSYFKEYAFIYYGMTEDNVMSTYCGFDMVHNNFDTKLSRFGRMEDFDVVYPTTKEQRDLLFQKMKEAGYEWDAKKKELKKISQRMISAEAKEAMYDKPAWNEEDENYLNTTIAYLKDANEFKKTAEKCIAWLKSLNQRIGGKLC